MLDTQPRDRLDQPQQDVAQPIRAPTPSGCRGEPNWFVVATKPQAERRAHAALHLKGYKPYLPLVTIRRPNRHYHIRPLFPGYLFTHLDLAHPWYPIRYAPGVWHLITVDGSPLPCPRGAVEAIQAAEEARRTPTPPEALWSPGTPVEPIEGVFRGVQAVVLKTGADMVLVSLLMFGELREVLIQADNLRSRDG